MSEAAQRTALVLGGGGARGLAHIGVLRVLEDNRVPVDDVVGTSIGALVGGLYAAGVGVPAMEAAVLGIDIIQVAKILKPKLFMPGFIDNNNVKKYIRSFVGDVRIENLPLPFAAVATDLLTGEEVVFDKGPLVEAIMASIAIPDLFQPVRAQGRYLVDGGLCNPLPVSIAKERGAERIVAVNVAPDPKAISTKKRSKRNFPTLTNVFLQSLNIGTNNLIVLHLRQAKPDVLIAPKIEEYDLLEFHKGREIMKRGREAAAAALPQLTALVRLDEPL